MTPKACATTGSLIRAIAVSRVTKSPIAACRSETARRFSAERPGDREQREYAERRLQLKHDSPEARGDYGSGTRRKRNAVSRQRLRGGIDNAAGVGHGLMGDLERVTAHNST